MVVPALGHSSLIRDCDRQSLLVAKSLQTWNRFDESTLRETAARHGTGPGYDHERLR